MTATEAAHTPKTGAALLILGAILLFVGPMLTFASFDLTDSGAEFEAEFESVLGDQTGYELEEGSTYVVLGGLVLIAGFVLLFARRRGARKALAILAFLAATVSLVAAYIDLTGVQDVIDASSFGFLTGNAGIGPWVIIVGSALALVGSVLAFRARPMVAVESVDASATPAPPPPTPPPAPGDTTRTTPL